MREKLLTHRGGGNYPGSKPRAREGVKVVSFFDVKTMFDGKKRGVRVRLEISLSAMLENLSQAIVGEEVSPAVVEDEEVVYSNVPVQRKNGKSHTIDRRRRQSNVDECAVIRKGHKVRASWRSETQPATDDAPNGIAVGGKGGGKEGAASNVFEGESITKDRSDMARELDALVFLRARSAQVTVDLEPILERV